MLLFPKLSCFSIFALLFTVNSVIGDKSVLEPCVPYTNEPCVINKIEYVLRGKTIELPCYDGWAYLYQIQWFKNGQEITLEYSGQRLIIKDVDYKDDGVYTCVVEISDQSYHLHSINLTIQSLPYFTFAPQHVNVVDGRTVELKCQADGVPKPTIKWMKNSQELNEKRYEVLESGDLQIRKVSFEDTGEYTCVATNAYDSVETTVRLTLKQSTKITDFPKNLELNDGDTAKFTCKAVPDPDLELRIHWLKNGMAIDVASEPRILRSSDSTQITIIKVNELDAGNYTCVASTDLDETSASASLVIYGVPKPPTLLGVDCGTKEARVSWNATGDDHWPITHYSIEYSTMDYTPFIWRVAQDHITVGNQSYIIKVLPWVNYTFRVIAWNQVGASRPSSHSSICTTLPDVPYKNPDDVHYESFKSDEIGQPTYFINIKWKGMSHIEHNAPKFAYRIYMKRDIPGENWTIVTSVRDMNEYNNIVTDSTYQRYRIKVTAVNEIGECKEPAQEIIAYSGQVPV